MTAQMNALRLRMYMDAREAVAFWFARRRCPEARKTLAAWIAQVRTLQPFFVA